MAEIFEFRGVDNLVYAEVTGDDNEAEGGYIAGTVKPLSPVASIAKSTSSSNEAHYYDNNPMIVVSSEASDEITLTVAPLALDVLAEITGKSYDPNTGMLVDGERVPKYFAIGYRTKGTDGKYRYVWRLKGTFGIPDEQNDTENDGTDTTNTELTFTGIATTHKFEKGRFRNNAWEKAQVKGIVVDERFDKVDLTDFFGSVKTPDTVTAKST